MKRVILPAALAVMLVGCSGVNLGSGIGGSTGGGLGAGPSVPAGEQHAAKLQSKPDTAESDAVDWAAEMRTAIAEQFNNSEQYNGKSARVRLCFDTNGNLTTAKAEGGDTALSSEIIASAKDADMPPFPSKEVYAKYKNSVFDFDL